MSQSQSISESAQTSSLVIHSVCFFLSPNTSHTSLLFLSLEQPLSPFPISYTPHRLVLTRILAMAVNTFPLSDPFGSKEVKAG